MTLHRTGTEYAQERDRCDPLAPYRARFHIPKAEDGSETVYFCGNSLGLQPKTVREAVLRELDDWQRLGVEGHFHARRRWLSYHEGLTEPLAGLVGALPIEVVAMNSLTVNLHLLMVSFYRPTPARHRILIEGHAFPSDRYAVVSQLRHHGFDVEGGLIELTPRPGESALRLEDIEETIDREGAGIALVLLGGVHYYTGQFFDIERIARAAAAKGCVVGVDLAHAAGNVTLRLHDWNVDFAAWCSYKYLNSGPGSVAGAFVHERHARSALPRFAGWWGHDKPSRFRMGPDFEPIEGAEGWQLSNPPILSLAAVRASLELFHEVGMEALREKSVALTGYLEFLLDELKSDAFSVLTPRDPSQRGCQLSLAVRKDGRRVFESLSRAGVVCDWREPDCIRVAPVPMYNSFGDVRRFVELFAERLP